MSHEMETIVAQAFAAVDAADADRLIALCDADVEVADEVTRRWIRGRRAVEEQVRRELADIPDIVSEPHDIVTREIGDVGLVTFSVRQRYGTDGEAVTVDGPATMVLRRVHGAWRITCIQSTPMPVDPE